MDHEYKTVRFICNGNEIYSQSYRDDSEYYDLDIKNWFDNKGEDCHHELSLILNTGGTTE